MESWLDKVSNEISPSDLSVYYLVSGIVSAFLLCQSVYFVIRSFSAYQKYEIMIYVRSLALISSLYAVFSVSSQFLYSSLLMIGTQNAENGPFIKVHVIRILSNAAFMYYSYSIFSSFAGKQRFYVQAFICVTTLAIIILGLTTLNTFSLSIASTAHSTVSFIILLLRIYSSPSIKPSRMVKIGIIFVSTFNLVTAILSLEVDVFITEIWLVSAVVTNMITNSLFALITTIHYLDLKLDYDVVSVEHV